MTRILSGTAAVVGGGRTVTFTGAPLSDANCPADAAVVLAGATYFIDHRVDTIHFVLTRDYEGVTGTVSCEIDPTNANAISLVKIARSITDYNARLALLDADGKGLFCASLGVTGANDPGPGKVGRNQADWALTTALYLDVLDAGGRVMSGLIDQWAPNTIIIVRSIASRAYASYRLTSVASNEGPGQWRKLTALVYVGGDGIIADGEDVAIEWNRSGAAGPIIGIPLIFDGSGITDIDPGVGKVRANHATNPTMLFVSKTDAAGGDIAARLATLGTSTNSVKAQMRFQPSDGGNTFMDYNVTGLTNAAGYVKLAVVLLSGVLASDGQKLALGAAIVPNKGADGTGTGDMVGPAGAVPGSLTAFDGSTGKLTKSLTAAQATATLNAVTGDSGSGGTKGLVPAPAAGDAAAGKFLKADGTWAAVSIAELELTVSQLALQVADNTNVALFLGPTGNRVADSFDTLTYVDVSGGTNLDSSVAGLLKPATTIGARLVGTSANAAVNDNDPGTSIAPPLGNLTGAGVPSRVLAQIDYGAVVTIARIEAKASYGGGASGFGLYYSNDGAAWTELGADFAITGTIATYQRDGAVSARYIAFVVAASAFSGTAVTLYDLNGYGAAPANLTVRSTSFAAASAPTKMKALIRVKEVDAATAGTDYTLECSRDGGTTYAVMALTELFTSPSPTANIRVVEAAETSVSGQPSGTAPRWRFKTLNNKSVELHDVYFYWS